MALPMHISIAAGALALTGIGDLAPLVLLEDLTQEPRVVGSAGYLRGLAILERELTAAGLDVRRDQVEVTRAIPRRSEVLLFEDEIADSAFAGLRERWDPAAVPTMPTPPAYAWNPEQADVRGSVVDCGAGEEADFERLVALRVPVSGTVALVSLPRDPEQRQSSVRVIAGRAWAAGCSAVLIAPAEPGPSDVPLAVDDYILEDTAPAANAGRDGDELALPVAPIRTIEAQAIRERLRVKRVRGDDGRGTTVRLGPGPVEAAVTIDCPRETLTDVPVLFCRWPGDEFAADATRTIGVAADECVERPLNGAAVLAAVVAAAKGRNAPGDGAPVPDRVGLRLVLAPRHALVPPNGSDFTEIEAALAPGGPDGGPTRLPALLGESIERLSIRLDHELSPRLDAAVLWIDYSLLSPGGSDSARGTDALNVLLAPLPGSR